MKSKNLTKSIVAVILGATVSFSAFAITGCGPEQEDPGNNPGGIVTENAKVEITADKKEMKVADNDTVTLSATVTEFAEKSVNWSLSGAGASYVDFDDTTGKLSFNGITTPPYDMTVTVTATSTVSANVKSSVIITLRALYAEGMVNELSDDMIKDLGNASITVTGEVEDVLFVVADNKENINAYDSKVMMSDGAWYGEWNRKGSGSKDIKNYRRGDPVTDTDYHTYNQVYIGLNNQKASKPVTDFNSFPAYWETQMMYNQISKLANMTQWEYDAVNDVYAYLIDDTPTPEGDFSADMYLRTYLAYSLTPMLGSADTFEEIYFYLDDNGEGDKYISKMVASTYKTYYGAEEEGSSEGATHYKYTRVTLNFSSVGTTVVPEPTPFTVDEVDAAEAETLKQALVNMGNAHNYTFKAVETTVSAPESDEGDYNTDAVSTYSFGNGTSATGTEGLVGYVTEDAIMLARTGKYSSSMDGNLYWTQYSGYKQLGDHYDYFEWNSDKRIFAGQRKHSGNLFDNMPEFKFAAEIFELEDSNRKTENGQKVWYHTFTLREPAVTRDVAMQISAHSYATDALGSTHGTLKITVRDDGVKPYIYSTEYPYDLISGTYLGVIQTTYSAIGTTSIDEDNFEGYEERQVATNWSGYNVKYYHPDHSTVSPETPIDAGTLLKLIFGNAQLPLPTRFTDVFGDAMSGPFFEWDDKVDAVTGVTSYVDYVSLTISLDVKEADENGKIDEAKYKGKIDELATELAKDGFVYDPANSYTAEWGDRYAVFVNAGSKVKIKIHNNRTRFFFIDIMPV